MQHNERTSLGAQQKTGSLETPEQTCFRPVDLVPICLVRSKLGHKPRDWQPTGQNATLIVGENGAEIPMSSRFLRKLKISLLRASKLRLGAFLVKKVNKRKQTYNLHYPNDLQDLRRRLLPGDVLLVEGDHGVSDWIKVYSSHTWSHCALFIGDQSRSIVATPGVCRRSSQPGRSHYGQRGDSG